MNDLSVIDQFLNVYSRYIDSGFGLLGGEVAFLTATLVVIDMTLAGLFWAMGGEEVIADSLSRRRSMSAQSRTIIQTSMRSRASFSVRLRGWG